MEVGSAPYIELKEELDARDWADEIALHTTGNYHMDWGQHNEKWLMGKNNQWYFINQEGEVWKWDGKDNIIQAGGRSMERFLNGTNKVTGKYVTKFSRRFYDNPELLCARFFNDVTTGPDVFNKMAGEGGTIRVGNYRDGELAPFNAQVETHVRLTGVLFGPTPSAEFDWTLDSFLQVIPERELSLINSDDARKEQFNIFVSNLVDQQYKGKLSELQSAPSRKQLRHWYELWLALQIEAPPRQTCLVVTLNDPVLDELARVVGRPVLGKPRGRILQLATGECGINAENLHLGGPPVDNVAIDEEGSITLVRLVSLSAFIGISLAYLSFRSIRVTLMLFFVGGVAAMASLAFVWFGGSSMDAILMTMPSLVYVLGLSGAVHVVNYYRDACLEDGEEHAADTAVAHGLFPCSLAAFTTALGLASLYTSNLIPIKKFGLFSAIGTVATIILLFTYLPASLTIWSPGYKKQKKGLDNTERGFSLARIVEKFWDRVGNIVVKRYAIVSITALIASVFLGYGLTKIETNVQLLKLFRSDAKILDDYRWMESNLGKLVPMELVARVDSDALWSLASAPPSPLQPEGPEEDQRFKQKRKRDLRLDMLQRMELSDRLRRYVLQVLGEESPDPTRRTIGPSMSSDVLSPLSMIVATQEKGLPRISTNSELADKRDALLEQDYMRVDNPTGDELWRISLRLDALNDVDYGHFVNELKTVVEPVLSAYRFQFKLLKQLQNQTDNAELDNLRILVLGPKPTPRPDMQEPPYSLPLKNPLTEDGSVNQTAIFVDSFRDLLENTGFRQKKEKGRSYVWSDLTTRVNKLTAEDWAKAVKHYDAIILIDDGQLDTQAVNKVGLAASAQIFLDTTDHFFEIDPITKLALPGMLTAAERKAAGDPDVLVTTMYTGIVPIVYKAQRALLQSLVKSIGLAFVMIAFVMMILLRSWGEKPRFSNALNIRAGLISMLPNVFPILLIFGTMGFMGQVVDIGSMMTASVAMGVAVDDTIHFLNWFRQGIGKGLSRLDAIKLAYKKVATAMTQTTLIGGFGLSAFAFSTFMPTQRFGVLMLFLLAAALIGDLILLPALLASPLGKYFCNVKTTDLSARLSGDDQRKSSEEGGEDAPTGHGELVQQPLASQANSPQNTDSRDNRAQPIRQPFMLKGLRKITPKSELP